MDDIKYTDNYECTHEYIRDGVCKDCGHDESKYNDIEELQFEEL